MTVGERVTYSQDAVASELIELRKSQLLKLIIAVPAVGWLYYIFAASTPSHIDGMPLLLALLLTCGEAFWLRHKHYQAASWLVLLGILLATSLTIIAHPSSLAIAFAALTIIAAGALLDTGQVLLVTLFAGLASAAALQIGTEGAQPGVRRLGEALLLYGLVFGGTWISHDPPKTAVEWALSAWEQVHKALLETRQRRADIYRTARALDEATYRIERMNNELIMARHAAEIAKANKVRFAATVSHELRGPLNLILGFSRLMILSPERYGVPLPRGYRADVDTIYVNSQHIASLIDDILDLSQIEMADLPLVRDHIDLEKDVVQESINTVRSLIERKGLYLRMELAGDLAPILADKVRLRQVVINLLTNAVRFTERGGITIRTAQDENNLLVSVQDTGRGIAPGDMRRLFEEFYRVQTAETEDIEKSTGLGLAISKYLVGLHGGRIWADSTVGVGTTFHFTIPLPGVESVAYRSVRTRERVQRSQPFETCLIAHRDPVAVRLLARHLEGYRVVGVPDERQVLALVRELHPRAIITTPDLGRRVRSQLSQTPFDVPVISCPMPDMTQDTFDKGVLTYLIKPITPEMVEATMRQLGGNDKSTVMIVDDEPDAVRLLEIMLTSSPRPYRILKAYDGLQALELVKDIVPDVVFMDLIMPGMDGRQTIERMRADERLRTVPVIIISARDPSDHVATLGMPIHVWRKRPLAIAQGVKCLKALLDTLTPDYLPEQATLESPAPGPRR